MQWIVARNSVPVVALIILVFSATYSLVVDTTDRALRPFENEQISLVGTVVRDSDTRERIVRVTIQPESINESPVESKKIIISVDRFANVRYGDKVRVDGTLRSPEAFETDTGRTFDYPKYLIAHGISHELSFPSVEVLESGKGNLIVAALISLKHGLIWGIEQALPEPYAALGEGLLLGEKQSLGDKLYDAFTAAGVVHIIVLSGYNVALVINAVLFIALRVLPRMIGYGLAAMFVIGFAILTGGSETTIRATIMALLMMVARVLHRPAAALRGLLIAAAVMALLNPFLVLYDLSFQLSVLATLGLILFSDGIGKRIPFVPSKFGVREIVATTIATQITVLPLLILSIGAVSLVFLPANALILPAVPLAMFLAFIAALAAFVVPGLSAVIAFPACLVLAFIIGVAQFFGTLPFARINIPSEGIWTALLVVLVGYAIFFYLYVMKRNALK